MSTSHLFEPLRIGAVEARNRILLAPLTRMRAGPGNVPGPMNATYYRQRASAGLIVAEATQVVPEGQGYPNTPGIHSPQQIEGWRRVTDAVHAAGGLIFLQLWHVGRVSHSSFQPGRVLPVSASAVRIEGRLLTAAGPTEYETPRALEQKELAGIVDGYRRGAENARAAGFDGVEVHGANGYLLEQFLNDQTNHRTDAWGGSIVNRSRLLIETMRAVCDTWSADRVGVRLSPWGIANDCTDSDPVKLHAHVIGRLAPMGLAYLHLIEPRAAGTGRSDALREDAPSASGTFRKIWPGALIAAGGFTADSADAAIAAGTADAVAFGRWFISTPDLPARFRRGAELTPYNRKTFYGGAEAGYTDYPTL